MSSRAAAAPSEPEAAWLAAALQQLNTGKVTSVCQALDSRSGGDAVIFGRLAAELLSSATPSALSSTAAVTTLLRGPHKWSVARQGSRSTCGKQYTAGAYCYHCRECESDRTCCVCVECFEEARHVGHDYRLVRAGGGMCDCGDDSAWARAGSCSKHGGAVRVVDDDDDDAAFDQSEFFCSTSGEGEVRDEHDMLAATSAADRAVMLAIVHALLTRLVTLLDTVPARAGGDACAIAGALCSASDEHGDPLLGAIGNVLLGTTLAARFFALHDRQSAAVRTALAALYTKLFVHKPFKMALARQMLQLFERAAELGDSRTDLLVDLSVQVLTVPAIAARLVQRHEYLERSLAAIAAVFAPRSPLGRVDTTHVNFTKMRYWRLLVDLEYIMTPFVCQTLVYGAGGRRLALLLDALERVQFADPNYRFLQHPGRDPFDPETTFTLHLRLRPLVAAVQRGATSGVEPAIATSLQPAADYQHADAVSATDVAATWGVAGTPYGDAAALERFNGGRVATALRDTLRLLARRAAAATRALGWHTVSLWRALVDVYDCNLVDGAHKISYHLPLHRAFASVLGRATVAWPLLDTSLAALLGADEAGDAARFVHDLLEPPLQLAVLNSQVARGRWRRNGTLATSQVYFYQSVQFRDMRADDLLLLQWAAAELWRLPSAPRAPHFLAAVLHRWGIESHIEFSRRAVPIGKAELMATKPDDGDEVGVESCAALVDALHFLTALHSDRTCVGAHTRRAALRRAIVHALVVQPLAYSMIGALVPEHLSTLACFDDVLAEVATSESGTGSRSQRYALRMACWREYDPFYLHFAAPELVERANANFEAAARVDASLLGAPRCEPVHARFTPLVDALQSPQLHALLFAVLYNAAVGAVQMATPIAVYDAVALLALVVDAAERTLPPDTATPAAPTSGLPTAWYRCFTECSVYVNAAARFTSPSTQPHVSLLAVLTCLRLSPAHVASHALIDHCRQRLCARSAACDAEWRRAVAQFGGAVAADAEADSDSKKERARRRRERMMAQFKTQQQAFVGENVKALSDSDESDTASTATPSDNESELTHDDVCVICREPATTQAGYVCNVVRSLDYHSMPAVDETLAATAAAAAADPGVSSPVPSRGRRFEDDDDGDDEEEEEEDEPAPPQQPEPPRRRFIQLLRRIVGGEAASSASAPKSKESGGDDDDDGASVAANVDELLGDGRQHATLVQQCGHRMHEECFHKFCKTFVLRSASTQRLDALGLQAEKNEFVCPLCKRVGNALLPPPLDESSMAATPGERSLDEWLDGVEALLGPQPPSASPAAPLSSMAASFVARVRAIDRDVLVSTNETRAVLNLLRSVVDTVRQAELRFRSVALLRDERADLGVESLVDCAMQQRRWLAAQRRLVGVLFMTLARDDARSAFVLLWRELHPSESVARRRIDAFAAFGELLLLFVCATVPESHARAHRVPRDAFLACLDYVYRAVLDTHAADETLQVVFLRQALLFEWALGAALPADSGDDGAPAGALASLQRHFALSARDDAAAAAAVHKRRRTSDAPPLRLHADELDVERRHFRFAVAFPRLYQSPAFFVALTQSTACEHCGAAPPMTQPLLCVLCGAAFCATGDFRHLREHAVRHNGMFACLAVRDSRVYLSRPPLWHSLGTFYFDDHGEVDGGLRRGRPLYLNVDHLAAMLDMWLAHDAHSFATGQL